jgi:hypothetical protein
MARRRRELSRDFGPATIPRLEPRSLESLATALALVGVVIVIASLLSGVVRRDYAPRAS